MVRRLVRSKGRQGVTTELVGNCGLSSGLAYVPGELVELCKVVAGYRGFHASHIRDDGAQLMEAIREAIEVSSESGEPVQIPHHKGLGKHHRGRAENTLKLIAERRARGRVDVSYDVYPYVASSTWLSACLPMWAFEEGVEMLLARLRDGRVREDCQDMMVWIFTPCSRRYSRISASLE